MPAPNDIERWSLQVLQNADWLQGIVCAGCTNLWYERAEIVDAGLMLSEARCLNSDCLGHNPEIAYLKAWKTLIDYDVFPSVRYGVIRTEEAADA